MSYFIFLDKQSTAVTDYCDKPQKYKSQFIERDHNIRMTNAYHDYSGLCCPMDSDVSSLEYLPKMPHYSGIVFHFISCG